MSYIKSFEQISKQDTHIAGGKGASLGEMTQVGIPVPPGFVVLASAFEKFLADTDLGVEIFALLDTVDTGAMHTVEHASEKIQKLILTAEFSPDLGKEILQAFSTLGAEFVAVRSSATAEDSVGAAWAGQLETYLNTTKEDLLRNIQKCWASLYTPRAIFYGFEKGFHGRKQPASSADGRTENRDQKEIESNQQSAVAGQMTNVNGQGSISVAVVVQAMVQSEVAGIAFSVHPVTEDHNQLIIEAGYGLGEAVVSGQVTPDSYVVTKEPLEIVDKNISTQERMLVRSEQGGNTWVDANQRILTNAANDSESGRKQKLSDEKIVELAKLIVKIEQHYGTPQDIEWAWVSLPSPGEEGEGVRSSSGTFYITQSRPITTLRGGGAQSPPSPMWEFGLSYSRDCSVILEQAWYKAQTEGFEELFGERNPHGPVNVYYINDGLLEIWENKNAVTWLTTKLREFVGEDDVLVDGFIDAYTKTYSELNKIWERSSVDMGEFVRCCEIFFIAVKEFARIFYLAVDEQVSSIVRAKALELRASDNLMDGMDGFIRQHLGLLVPHLFGIETLVLLDEIRESPQELDENIVNRRLGWVVLPGSYYFLGSLESFSNLHPEFNFELNKKENVNYKQHLSGAIAYRGRTKGKVVLVNKKSEIEKVSSGDVLVSRMTIPDFIGAMKLASAIVTDEGGITSHAAIISRELQKPCIIGTKIATQVLHDGDLVEVDAERGVVRVLERVSRYPASINWWKVMERKNLFFVGLAFAEVETVKVAQLLGFSVRNQLFKYEKGVWTSYRSIQEYEELYKHITRIIRAKDDRIVVYAQQGIKSNSIARRYIQEHLERPTSPTIENYNKEYRIYRDALTYGVTIPWFVIGALETMDLTERKKYTYLLDAFEPLMTVSVYPDFEKYVLQKYRQFISKKYNLVAKLSLLLMPDELQSVIGEKFVPSVAILDSRYQYCVYWREPHSGKWEFSFTKEIENILPILKSEHMGEVTQLSGSVAYHGVVQGKVRIVFEPEDCDEFIEGEILVAPSTNPSLMAAIIKCAGIVTDEGGLTSHASIIARELKKPTIIGTRVATKVFKDGDMVKIDTDKGIVIRCL